jgi:hypothetical protein
LVSFLDCWINTKNISFTHHTKEIQDKFSHTQDPNASHNAQKKRKRAKSLWFDPRALPFCRYLSKKHLKWGKIKRTDRNRGRNPQSEEGPPRGGLKMMIWERTRI